MDEAGAEVEEELVEAADELTMLDSKNRCNNLLVLMKYQVSTRYTCCLRELCSTTHFTED